MCWTPERVENEIGEVGSDKVINIMTKPLFNVKLIKLGLLIIL